jgi:hypothetical protein
VIKPSSTRHIGTPPIGAEMLSHWLSVLPSKSGTGAAVATIASRATSRAQKRGNIMGVGMRVDKPHTTLSLCHLEPMKIHIGTGRK